MLLLILGIAIWSLIHFIPASAVEIRSNLIRRFGAGPYKATFAVITLASLLLMIFGWPNASKALLYIPPAQGALIALLLTFIAFVLFFAPYMANNFRRLIRHPQLVGVIFWGSGHLLANGESRSVVLFGGLAIWALIEILLLNRRDGSWSKPATAPVFADIKLLLVGAGLFTLFMFSHQLLFGVAPAAFLSS